MAKTFEMGPTGLSGGGFFMDQMNDDEEIASIVVRSGDWIDAVQIVARRGNDVRMLPRRGGDGGGARTFALRPGEKILSISGSTGIRRILNVKYDTYDNYISSIHIETNQGRVFKADGLPRYGFVRFSYFIPGGFELSGLKGRSGVYLDAIGIVMRAV